MRNVDRLLLLFLMINGHFDNLFSRNSIKSKKYDRMTISELLDDPDVGSIVKENLFGAKRNSFCKDKDRFCPSQCHYDIQVAYDYFMGASLPWSSIPSVSFNDIYELNDWACKQTHNTYLIAYSPGCPACAQLLAAIETRAYDLQSSGIKVYKMNMSDLSNRDALYGRNSQEIAMAKSIWNCVGTPTVWNVGAGAVEETKEKTYSEYYDLFIKFRKEQKIEY